MKNFFNFYGSFIIVISIWFFALGWLVIENISSCSSYNEGAMYHNCRLDVFFKDKNVQESIKNIPNFFNKEYNNLVENIKKDPYTASAVNIMWLQDYIINPLEYTKKSASFTMFWVENNGHIHTIKDNINLFNKDRNKALWIVPIFIDSENYKNINKIIQKSFKKTNTL